MAMVREFILIKPFENTSSYCVKMYQAEGDMTIAKQKGTEARCKEKKKRTEGKIYEKG